MERITPYSGQISRDYLEYIERKSGSILQKCSEIFNKNIVLISSNEFITTLRRSISRSDSLEMISDIEKEICALLTPICKASSKTISVETLQFANSLLELHKDIKNYKINHAL